MLDLNWKKIALFFSRVFNKKNLDLVIFFIILIQFFLVGIIFFELKKDKYLIEQTNFKAASIENRLVNNEKTLQALQSQVMRLSTQIYRIPNNNNEN